MPYFVERSGKGWKVYVHGRPLSRKPLTHEQAEKQKTAVILSELRRKGQLGK